MSNEFNQADASGASYTDWAKQVVENLVQAEKKWIELASEQNALTLKALQEGQEFYRNAPNPQVAQWAKEGLESFLEVQKKWSETIAQQREQFLQQVKQVFPFDATKTDPNAAATALNEFGKQQAELLIETQKRWLELASQQNAQIQEGARKAFGLPESPLTATINEWANQTVNNYIETQKRFLNFYSNYSKQG